MASADLSMSNLGQTQLSDSSSVATVVGHFSDSYLASGSQILVTVGPNTSSSSTMISSSVGGTEPPSRTSEGTASVATSTATPSSRLNHLRTIIISIATISAIAFMLTAALCLRRFRSLQRRQKTAERRRRTQECSFNYKEAIQDSPYSRYEDDSTDSYQMEGGLSSSHTMSYSDHSDEDVDTNSIEESSDIAVSRLDSMEPVHETIARWEGRSSENVSEDEVQEDQIENDTASEVSSSLPSYTSERAPSYHP